MSDDLYVVKDTGSGPLFRVLLVDDEPAVRDAYAQILRSMGTYHVTTAKDPHEAMAILKEIRFHAVITDVQMPGMNGFEFASRIKSNWPKMPLIMISAKPTSTTMDQAARCGSLALLEKPVNPEHLREVLEHALKDNTRDRRFRSVLVADDHRETREFLKTLLDEAGYDVTLAADGQEAVDIVRSTSTKFDIALIDLNMPKLPGPEAIVELRKQTPETLILLMTGEATSERIQQAYKAGGFTLIRKPFDIPTFLAAFASYERKSDQLKSEVEETRALARQPIHRKMARWWHENVSNPKDNKKKLRARFVMIMILCVVASVAMISVVATLQDWLSGFENRVQRMEEHVERMRELEEEDHRPKEKR